MKVYVILHYWTTPGGSGFDVLGVYSGDNRTKARLDLCRHVAYVSASYPADVWDKEETHVDSDEVSLCFGSTEQFVEPTEYRWQIIEREVE